MVGVNQARDDQLVGRPDLLVHLVLGSQVSVVTDLDYFSVSLDNRTVTDDLCAGRPGDARNDVLASDQSCGHFESLHV
jgi:hypothetical protein